MEVVPFPEVISMESSARSDSYYRVRYGSHIKYVLVKQGTLQGDDLLMPLYSLPTLPYDSDDWTLATITRNSETGELVSSLSNQPLDSVKEIWHTEKIDFLSLNRIELLTATAFECTRQGHQGSAIAKVARFEWEIPRIERETRAYRLLQGTDIAPQFLGHIQEHGRTVGLLVEKIEGGRSAGIEDLEQCKNALGRFHKRGLLHGDVNRFNFIISEGGIKLIDFENTQVTGDLGAFAAEIDSLERELLDDTGRGGGFETEDEDEC
ncbi:hypothetical protein GGS26DRAFT_66564 [Hypomontagnella submonticulosa]|nr:hypothetical protein GGS26DRAFT_66564 [Hypomontagnella submonticulosa]